MAVYKEDRLLLQLDFGELRVLDTISIEEGFFFEVIKRALFEAFNGNDKFNSLVPSVNDWSRVTICHQPADSDPLVMIHNERQMEALVIYWVRLYQKEKRGSIPLEIRVRDKKQ